MSLDGRSNIRVFIQWHGQTVFAGEEVSCAITFKNVAPTSTQQKQSARQSNIDRSRQGPRLQTHRGVVNSGLTPPPSASSSRGHRSGPPQATAGSRSRTGSAQWTAPGPQDGRLGNGHRKSVSIVSIGSTSTVDDQENNATSAQPSRYSRGHGRASSLQIAPRQSGAISNGPLSATHPPRHISSPVFSQTNQQGRFNRPPSSSTAPSTPSILNPLVSPRSASGGLSEFRFPAVQSPLSEVHNSSEKLPEDLDESPSPGAEASAVPMRTREPPVPIANEHGAPAARILAATSMGGGTPRSSGEFYSMSNNSTETLASEYPAQQPGRAGRPQNLRRTAVMSPQQAKLESLMMGYAQVQGSFTLDGSLVDLGPFEQVKRKAVVGGQGGGVVGVDTTKRDSGLLGGFGWSSITSSLGDLLGGGELSTIKEMRGVASSKAIPLLSTSQSILFVDLKLAPGESKTYEYSFRLPKGLPPSHRGKAVKITYSLVIGTQRPGGAKEQQVRSVDVPFRVLGSVNRHGEILGHDLMNPYVLLQDQATVKSVSKPTVAKKPRRRGYTNEPAGTMNEFLAYVGDLLNHPIGDSSGGLLSPTADPHSRRQSEIDESLTAKDAINLAILRGNRTAEGQQSPNRFEIARNGQRVAVVMLTRPAYRLGEVVTMVIDFANGQVPCYAVHSALETAERIDPSFAIRSEASIHRVTRRVLVTASEATLHSRRIVFSPTIPITATPEFITSGVSLDWKVRLEFVVPSDAADGKQQQEQEEEDGEEEEGESERPLKGQPLLEELSRDQKGGLVLVAVEHVVCESFEVAVPLRVYGAVGTGLEKLERDEAMEEGLPV